MAEEKGEKFEFQSEVKQLLDILVYSLYKNKEVFLRELCDRLIDRLRVPACPQGRTGLPPPRAF